MDRRHLAHFIAVVDAGSLSEAARRLHLSQPSVSQSIRELERSLGTILFVRGRGMSLTPTGRALVGPARQTLRGFDHARSAVEAVEMVESGRLDIAAVHGLTVDPLAPLLIRFHKKFPHVTLRIISAAFGTDGFETLRRGEAELLLTDHPAPYPRHTAVPVAVAPLMAVFSPNICDLPPGDHIVMADLLRYQLVNGLSEHSAAQRNLAAYLATENLPMPKSIVQSEHRDILPSLLLAGFGAALLSVPEAEAARGLGAQIRSVDLPEIRSAFLYYREEPLSPAARAFVEMAARNALD